MSSAHAARLVERAVEDDVIERISVDEEAIYRYATTPSGEDRPE